MRKAIWTQWANTVVTDDDGNSKSVIEETDHEVIFHEFTIESESDENGPIHVAHAIIEMDNGQIEVVYAGHIRFTEPTIL